MHSQDWKASILFMIIHLLNAIRAGTSVVCLPSLVLKAKIPYVVTAFARATIRLAQDDIHRRQSVAALQKAGNVRNRLAAFEANLKLGSYSIEYRLHTICITDE